MSGVDILTDEELIAGWDDLKDNLSSNGHDAAEVLFDYGDKLADALSRRASQAAPAPSALVKALRTAEAALSDIGDAEREEGDDLAWCEERAAKALPLIRPVLRAALITTPAPSDGLRVAVEAERERIAVALEAEADLLPCAEDAAVTRSNAALIRADFSYEDADRAALTPASAQEGDWPAKPACPICKGHSRFDQCSCHYEVSP